MTNYGHLTTICLSNDATITATIVPQYGRSCSCPAFMPAQKLPPYGDSLQLEVPAAKPRPCTDKRARGKILAEVGLVDGIELLEQGEVGAEHLNVHDIVHGHSSLRERAFHAVEHELCFVVNFGRRLAGFRIESDSSGEVQRVCSQNAVAVRRLYDFLGCIEAFSRGLRGRLGENAVSGQKSGHEKRGEREHDSAIHKSLLERQFAMGMAASVPLAKSGGKKRRLHKELGAAGAGEFGVARVRRRGVRSVRGRGKWRRRRARGARPAAAGANRWPSVWRA